MKHPFRCLIVLLLFPLLIGCGTDKPNDLPKLHPCAVKIVDKSGAAVDNVTVVVAPPDSKWASIGLTGPDGVAEMKTNGIYPGVPVGTHKVVVAKYDVKEVNGEPVETLLFDKSFADESTTPLQLPAKERVNYVTFEVF